MLHEAVDLVARIQDGWPPAPTDRATFYDGGAEGWVDYPAYFCSAKVTGVFSMLHFPRGLVGTKPD